MNVAACRVSGKIASVLMLGGIKNARAESPERSRMVLLRREGVNVLSMGRFFTLGVSLLQEHNSINIGQCISQGWVMLHVQL